MRDAGSYEAANKKNIIKNFSIEKKFGENLKILEEYLKVWNIENPDAKAYFTKAVEKDDKTYFAVTIEFDYPT